ncbi:MAG: YciI family protein [Pseudonocardiaceae bacterium]
MDQIMGEYWVFDKAVADAGVKVGGEALQGLATATTVRVRDGERVVTDGSFAETREVIGGSASWAIWTWPRRSPPTRSPRRCSTGRLAGCRPGPPRRRAAPRPPIAAPWTSSATPRNAHS